MAYRNITYRLVLGSRIKAEKVSQTAGACRYVWNRMLAVNRLQYRRCRVQQALMLRGAMPGGVGVAAMTEEARRRIRHLRTPVTFFGLGKAFTRLRAQTPWLQALPFACVRQALKYQADAWQRFFQDPQCGPPKRKGRYGDDSFTIPQDVKIRTDSISGVRRIWIPKIGWCVLKRRGGNPYEGCEPVQAVVKRVPGRSPRRGKWRCIVCYDVGDRPVIDNGLAVGLDRNCGQVAVSDGHLFRHPDIRVLEAKKRRYQRMMARRVKGSSRYKVARHRCAKTSRRLAMIRDNWHHQVSRTLAGQYGTVFVEALNTRAMTASAKGTAAQPGSNVKRKAGLNRSILDTGWAGLYGKLGYKAAHVVEVPAAHTSRRCSACGHTAKANRRSQSEFECVACGHQGNADINAALNILALGTGAAGRGGGGVARSVKRQLDMPTAALAPAG